MNDKILIAIIAASATLIGVIASQIITLFNAYRSRKHERDVFIRNKYEELMFYFSSSINWVSQLNNSQSKEELFSQSQSADARKALSLSLLYFPDVVDEINEYIKTMQEYYSFTVTAFDESIPYNAGGQALVHKEGKKLIDMLLQSKIRAENSIVNKAAKYTMA